MSVTQTFGGKATQGELGRIFAVHGDWVLAAAFFSWDELAGQLLKHGEKYPDINVIVCRPKPAQGDRNGIGQQGHHRRQLGR